MPTQFFLLSDKQHELWHSEIDEWDRNTEPKIIDGSGLISTYYDLINPDRYSFNVSVPSTAAERYFIVVIFHPDAIATGTLEIDWQQNDGSRIQFQYFPLGNCIAVVTGLLVVFLSYYVVEYVVLRRSSLNYLHYLYVVSLLAGLGFLASWKQGIEIESVTGDRFGFWTNWIPSIYQKLYDIVEVLFYLITALGWQTLRPTLTTEEVQMIGTGSAISFLLGILEIKCGEDTVECGGLTSARMVIHMFAFLTVIVAFTSNLAILKEMLNQSSIANYDTGKIFIHYQRFLNFRSIFFLYILQPTVAVVIRSDIIYWVDDWIFVTFFWSSKIFLLCALAVAFRPRSDPPAIVDAAVKQRRLLQRIRPQ